MATGSANKFCRFEDLSNEASVESFFVLRLLADLGYADREILTKNAIGELKVGPGRKKAPYRPDFMIVAGKKPRWIIDAKAPGQNPDDYTGQGSGYCLEVNKKYEDNPVQFYVLTNGSLTRVYRWDKEPPVMSLRFADFMDGNTKYKSLRLLLAAPAARGGWVTASKPTADAHLMTRPDMEGVKRSFYRCHQIIWKAEKVNPQAAFLRFAKILFVKLWEDRRLRNTPEYLDAISRGDPLPADAIRFSTRWIGQQEGHEENPVDRILFHNLVNELEQEIQQRKRKRIFAADARLDVSPGTAKRVVAELEHQYLFGIDEDLNGRMFEAFLSATMRGQELGQYFTPRSIVKLMTRLGAPIATPGHVERVLDGCCGTGGFLIEALTQMRRQIYENKALTNSQRVSLLNEVANEAIFGIDAGQDPPLVNIARINMYLHGDGGSRLYMTDGLRNNPTPSGTDNAEVKEEVNELRKTLVGDNPLRFDLVLTNPPFSMDYSRKDPAEAAVLADYDVSRVGGKQRESLRSAVMFIERYYDLLKPGGRLLTVIDDSLLSNPKYEYVRDFIRARFIINAVIGLHGDAFQRAGARVKTSVLCLTKRTSDEPQPDAFVYLSRYIGQDDLPPKTPASVAAKARDNAIKEIEEIVAAYKEFRTENRSGKWVVPANRLNGRLDAKYLEPWSVTVLQDKWPKTVTPAVLADLVIPIYKQEAIDPNRVYTFLNVTYEGQARPGEERLGKEISYPFVSRAEPNDIVVSNIGAVMGAICVLPEDMAEFVVTSEFTVMRMKDGVDTDPDYLWAILRSDAVIAEWLSGATGLSRNRVRWETLQSQVVPLLPAPAQKQIGDLCRRANALIRESAERLQEASIGLSSLNLDDDRAKERKVRAKPPK